MLSKETFQGHDLFKWNVGPSEFRMFPFRGARLMSWDLSLSGNQRRPVIHWPADADYQNLAPVRGGNPILFPFSARTFHKGKIEKWKSPGGEILPMPKHGFARDGAFEIVAVDDASISLRFLPTEEDKKAYPFDYEFIVVYWFRLLSIRVDFVLTNLGDQPIPWSAGHHFYFSLPWNQGLNRTNYHIELPACKSAYHAADGSLAPNDFKGGEVSMEDPAMVDRIHYRLKDSKLKFGLKNGEENVTIKISDAARPLPSATVVTWTEFPDSPFYCVEPWMGPPNSPEHKKGLHWVEPGETDGFKVRVTLEE
jgi:galactose mutarotase-like enzyme